MAHRTDVTESKHNATEVVKDGSNSDTERTALSTSVDQALEKRLVRKLDMYIIPVYMITYMIR